MRVALGVITGFPVGRGFGRLSQVLLALSLSCGWSQNASKDHSHLKA